MIRKSKAGFILCCPEEKRVFFQLQSLSGQSGQAFFILCAYKKSQKKKLYLHALK
jgi:hypothetical protein